MTPIELLKKTKLRFPIVWDWVEDINGALIKGCRSHYLENIKNKITSSSESTNITFKYAREDDVGIIVKFLNSLSPEDCFHFKPFPFTPESILHVVTCGTYQVYLAMFGKELVGLFFLRFFINRQCYLGFAVNSSYRGKGIGKKMIETMASAVKDSGFQLMSTVCADNQASIKAHMAAARFEIVDRLSSNEIVLRLKG